MVRLADLKEARITMFSDRPTVITGIVNPVSRRIRSYRECEGLSQEDLADLVGVLPGAVKKWEAGQLPGPANLDRLAAALDIHVFALLEDPPVYQTLEPEVVERVVEVEKVVEVQPTNVFTMHPEAVRDTLTLFKRLGNQMHGFLLSHDHISRGDQL